MAYLSRFKLPAATFLRRPPELVYASDDIPPTSTLFGLAFQHAATALALIAYVLAAANIGGLSVAATQAMITGTLLGMALSTFLQAWGGRLGAGMLVVHIPNPFVLVLSGVILATYGLPGLVVAGVVHGIVAFFAGWVLPKLRTVLPPTVAGVVVSMGGLSLIKTALRDISGLSAGAYLDHDGILVGLVTFGVIMGLSVWGSRLAKLFALLVGLVVGVVLAALLGRVGGAHVVAVAPAFGLPHFVFPDFHIEAGMIAASAMLSLMSQMDAFGAIVLMQKMNDADWRRPDMKMASGGIRACGISNFLTAWLGAFPNAVSSANIALAYISKSTARWVGLVAAAMLALIAFLPKVSVALTLIPTPVIGAVELYASAYLIVSGIELIASRALDTRSQFTVGLAFVFGIGVIFEPQLTQGVPDAMQFLARSGFIVSGVTAVGLNLLFRLGASQHASQNFQADATADALARTVVDFVERKGANWAARRDVVQRAAQAALEACEAIQAAGGRKLLGINGSFDEFNLDISLQHDGAPMRMDIAQAQVPVDLLDADDNEFDKIMERALPAVSAVMLARLADRITVGQRDGESYFRLHFEH